MWEAAARFSKNSNCVSINVHFETYLTISLRNFPIHGHPSDTFSEKKSIAPIY